MRIILETPRLLLREYLPRDFDALYVLLSDPITMQHYPKPYDESGTRRWLDWSLDNYARYGFGWWAMELKESGAFIGDCGITMQSIDGEILPEIGYHIYRDHWRQGYGKEAARAVRDWFFTHTDFPAVYAYMTVDNIASRSTAAAAGMTQIKQYTDGDEELSVYALTRDGWEHLKRQGL